MHVVGVGCGRVGATLSEQLERNGYTVAIIDRKADAFRRLPEGFSGQRFVGVGFDREVLKECEPSVDAEQLV